jgi:FtsP/CotA-like multicopper oxidase with cupredoxin domain
MASIRVSRRLVLGSGLIALFDVAARAAPAPDSGGFHDLEAAPGALRLLPDSVAETPVWAYNDAVPGPLLRYKKGEEVKIRLVNRLVQPTSLAWPGVRIANPMDGVGGLTQKPVAPGESFEYRFTPPDSGLFAYRPGASPFIAEQLGRGLYGALIVEEADPPQADRDLLAVVSDWRLDDEAAIAADFGGEADAHGPGRIGALVTLNSKPVPVIETIAPGARIRLRLLSAASARLMSISLEGARPLILAVDGQPADSAFEPVRATFPVGPGARFDLMFDLPPEAGAEAGLMLRGDGEPDRPLLVFKTEGDARAALPPIASLAVNPLLPKAIRLQDSKRVTLAIESTKIESAKIELSKTEPAKPPEAAAGRPLFWTVNGVALGDFSAKPLFSVRRGAPVTLAIVNRSGLIQQIHVHGHVMRLLHDLDDGWEPYWRDSVLVAPGKTKHLAFVADNTGKWVIESLIPDRQASGLATWFLVT